MTDLFHKTEISYFRCIFMKGERDRDRGRRRERERERQRVRESERERIGDSYYQYDY